MKLPSGWLASGLGKAEEQIRNGHAEKKSLVDQSISKVVSYHSPPNFCFIPFFIFFNPGRHIGRDRVAAWHTARYRGSIWFVASGAEKSWTCSSGPEKVTGKQRRSILQGVLLPSSLWLCKWYREQGVRWTYICWCTNMSQPIWICKPWVVWKDLVFSTYLNLDIFFQQEELLLRKRMLANLSRVTPY